MILLPGWRAVLSYFGKGGPEGRKSLFGRRTLLVGVDQSARALLGRLRQHAGDGYAVVGFIDDSRKKAGQMLDGIPVVGSIDNVGKVIHELRISDVIFSTQKLSYADILSVISRAANRSVNYHLVPTSMEVIIGKGSVDSLNEFPLVQISYNIDRPLNRVLKRAMDLAISSILLISAFPFVYWSSPARRNRSAQFIRALPSVFSGSMSLVGPPAGTAVSAAGSRREPQQNLNLGKPGLTGLAQLQSDRTLTPKEVEQLNLYYAKNQSLLLDLEILMKTIVKRDSANDTGLSQRRG